MDLNTLITALAEGIAADASIKAWTQTNYTANHTVFENIDARDRPEDSYCPMVVIRAGARSGGLAASKKEHFVIVDCLVNDSSKSTVNGVIVYRGGRNVEAFRVLVFAALKGLVPSRCQIDSVNVEYELIEQFPFFGAGMTVLITQEQLIGQDPFE